MSSLLDEDTGRLGEEKRHIADGLDGPPAHSIELCRAQPNIQTLPKEFSQPLRNALGLE
jgi:hypothetical protein